MHEQRGRLQPFVQASYRVDADGQVRADMPSRCPGSDRDGLCRVVVHARRERGQGPSHPLIVARCCEHARAFTLYPPGWVPYGRRPVCHVSPAGYPVRSESEEGTLFGAAWDAALGLLWPRCGASGDQGVQRTQGRHLERTSVLLAVHAGVDERVREAMSAVLGVPLLALHEAGRSYAAACSWRERGQCLMEVLGKVGARERAELWTRAGYTTGLWGRPSRWDPGGTPRAARTG